MTSVHPGRGWAATLVLHFQETALHPHASPWPIREKKKVAHTLQSNIVTVKIETKRKVDIGSLQVHVEQAVDGNLYLSGIILTNLGAHSNKQLSSKSDGWPW